MDKIVLYTVKEIQDIFKIGRTKAYELMSSNGFPSFKINNRIYVEEQALENWLRKRAGKAFNF